MSTRRGGRKSLALDLDISWKLSARLVVTSLGGGRGLRASLVSKAVCHAIAVVGSLLSVSVESRGEFALEPSAEACRDLRFALEEGSIGVSRLARGDLGGEGG